MFMLPILLCIVGWGSSIPLHSSVMHTHAGYYIFCDTIWGIVNIGWGTNPTVHDPDGWMAVSDPAESTVFLNLDHGVLGFGYGQHSTIHDGRSFRWAMLSIPYWFLLMLAVLGEVLVWRKTRPKANPATAFPVIASGDKHQQGSVT